LVGGESQFQVAVKQLQELVDECLESIGWWCARSEGRRTSKEGVLKVAHLLVEQRFGEPGSISESTKDGAFADAGGRRYGVHRDSFRAVLDEETSGSAEDALAVGGCVSALTRRVCERK
jgi:hypothetical protein